MLIGDKFVYFDLQKTGSSHILKVLSTLPSIKSSIYGKHSLYNTIPENRLLDFNTKIKVGSIRNPWDWYVSIWAFGCLGKGNLYRILTKRPKLSTYNGMKEFLFHSSDRIEWKRLYKNSFDKNLFRQWLKYILVEKKSTVGEGFGESVISDFAGFLTYRYLKLFTYDFSNKSEDILDYKKLIEFDKKNNFIDIILKTETIDKLLINNAPKMGIHVKEIKDVLDQFSNKTNKSIRKTYRYYYDDETMELVKEKEKFIIEKYNYKY